MFDPHVHLRDWDQAAKETVARGLQTAARAGLTGVVEMPNTSPALTDAATVRRRIQLGDAARAATWRATGIDVYHGIWMGIGTDLAALEDLVALWREAHPRVVGFKLYAGHSTGNMGLTEAQQRRAALLRLVQLGYDGPIAVHAEEESLLRPERWNPSDPSSHSLARPPIAEVESVRAMIALVHEVRFEGLLHICHVSHPDSVESIAAARRAHAGDRTPRFSCAATPAHLWLDVERQRRLERSPGVLWKLNPPLRTAVDRRRLVAQLERGLIDWIETDHAPHTYHDKVHRHASGLPGLHVWPLIPPWLRERGLSSERIDELTGGAALRALGITEDLVRRVDLDPELEPESEPSAAPPDDPAFLSRRLGDAYGWDPYRFLRDTEAE